MVVMGCGMGCVFVCGWMWKGEKNAALKAGRGCVYKGRVAGGRCEDVKNRR